MTVMFLWIFYRAKHDGAAVLGLEHPWDHGDQLGGVGGAADNYQWKKEGIGSTPTLA